MSKSMLRALVGAFLAVGLAFPAQGAEPGAGATSDRTLLSELVENGARIERHAATGHLRFVGPTADRPIAGRGALGRPATADVAAGRFMARYGSLFGVSAAAENLRIMRSASAIGGNTFVRYQQLHRGVPVLGGEISVQVGKRGDILSANGEASPGLQLGVQPATTAAAARKHAVAAIAKARGLRTADLVAAAPELWVYDPRLLGGRVMPFVRLVWRTEVTNRAGDLRELVLIDALRGNVALHFDQIAEARNRITCDGEGTVAGSADDYPCTVAEADRTETGPASTFDDVNDAHVFAGHTYDFFFNRFGRDSLDGAGMSLVSTVRYCRSGEPCPYQNAFWDGSQMVYGTGFAGADDVVGHELTHGVTQFTSGLFYYYQSGAINEALSDIFGEFIDLTNGVGSDTAADRWLMGEDLPAAIGAIRDMQDPTAFGDPDRMKSSSYWSAESDQGGVHANSGVANKAAYLMTDGDTFNGQTVTGLGIDKAAAIWYRVETSYLISGSDYADLGSSLKQACSDLVGTTPKQNDGSPSPSGAISAADCTEVGQAVLATEMALQPTAAGAVAPEAALCSSGTPTNTWFDDLENTVSGNWTTEAVTGSENVWYYPQNPNAYDGFDATYATSGTTNFWGDDADFMSDSAIRMTSPVTVPAGGFLHFRHAYSFQDRNQPVRRYDGGVVEYQVGGAGWTDAGSLPTVNGYNGTIASTFGNPLGGRSAFTAESHGYISTRYDLSGLASQNVKFRFRIGTDSVVGDYGWFLDDIRIYTCPTATDTTAPTVTKPGTDFRSNLSLGTGSTAIKLRVSWTASDPSGVASTKLQQSVNAGAFADVTLASAAAVAANVSVAASTSTTRQFRARATDTPGNTSSYQLGDIFKVRAFQNGSVSVVQTGSWNTQSSSGFYGGSVRYASTGGRTQSLTATATDFAVVSTRGPNRGIAEVRVDGVLMATVDLYRSSTQKRRVIYSISFPTAATHTIELRVSGTKRPASSGTRVDFDAFLTMAP